MVSANQMLEMYEQAQSMYYITDLANYADCDSECSECPAQPSCKQLSNLNGESDYETFQKNFDKLIRPNL